MAVLLGMASKDERGRYRGGTAGDQTGKEVYIRTFYSRPWDRYILINDSAIREKFAHALEVICSCNKVGYSQSDRLSLWNECEKISWNINRISEIKACNCDCSSLMAVCAGFAGLNVGRYIWTGNLEAAFKATGKVTVYKDAKYITSDKYLQRGGILLNTQYHVAGVLSNGSAVSTGTSTGTVTGGNAGKASETATTASTKPAASGTASSTTTGKMKIQMAKERRSDYAKAWKVATNRDPLNMRLGAGKDSKGVDFPVICQVPKGQKVQCYCYYNTYLGIDWLLCVYKGNIGYCCKTYLR